MIHNNKVYANADEKFVKATIVYGDQNLNDIGTRYLYHDKTFKHPVLSTELFELFANGLIVNFSGKTSFAIIYHSDDNSVETPGTDKFSGVTPTK